MANTKPLAAQNPSHVSLIASAVRAISVEAEGLGALAASLRNGLGAPLVAAVELIRNAKGRVVVTGMGKSGHIARTIAATMASTGTTAFFIHAGDAGHGDLGMIAPDSDVIVALSWSGETTELKSLID
jgi:arabinose-5-phosphate isomerase